MQREVAHWISDFADFDNCLKVSKSFARLVLEAQAVRYYKSLEEARAWVKARDWTALGRQDRLTINHFGRIFWAQHVDLFFDEYLYFNFQRLPVEQLSELDPELVLDFRVAHQKWNPWVRLVRPDTGSGVTLAQLVCFFAQSVLPDSFTSYKAPALATRLIDKWVAIDLNGCLAILISSCRGTCRDSGVDGTLCVIAYVLFRYVLKFPIGDDFLSHCRSSGVEFAFFSEVMRDHLGLTIRYDVPHFQPNSNPLMLRGERIGIRRQVLFQMPGTLVDIIRAWSSVVLRHFNMAPCLARFLQMIEDK